MAQPPSMTSFDAMYGGAKDDELEAPRRARKARAQKKKKKKDEVDNDDEMVLSDDFETANPLALLDGMETEDPDADEADDNAEAEEIPVGISIPKTQNRGAHNLKSKGKDKKQRKRDSKRSSSKRASRRATVAADYEDHELLAGAAHDDDGASTTTAGAPHELLDDDEDDEDAMAARRRRGWFWWASPTGLGGGAMSPGTLLLLAAPALAVNFIPGVSYARGGQLLFIPLFVYVLLSLPVFFGWVFATGLRRWGPLNGFPFRVGALSVVPWIKDWRMHVRLVVYDAAFGNPPGFPFESFLTVERLDIEGSFPLRHLWNLLLRRKEASPLKRVPDFERYVAFEFPHVEVTGAMCCFQMYDGRFNVNTFTQILADGEVRRVLGRREPAPNQLSVRVVRARGLRPGTLRKTCDPYVLVRCRRQARKTHSQNRTTSPMWNETLTMHVEDASTVIEVVVLDRESADGSQAGFLGHWCMTAKYLVTDPSFNWHYDEGYETVKHGSRAHKAAPELGTGFSGWVPLATKKWKRMGLCGQLELEVRWAYVPEDELEKPYVPARRYTALEQLSMQSHEDQLRFGDWARVRQWLDHEPFCYDVKRFTVRDTRFYVQDLFRGHKGVPESLVLSQSSVDGADCVRLPFLEMRKQFRPRHPGDEGITSYDAFVGFFVGLLTSAARSGRLGGAIAQILSGGVWNFGYKFRNLLRGELDKALVPFRARQIRGVAQLARSGFQVLHQNVTQTRRNRAQFKVAVEADDEDFLEGNVELQGHLLRCAVRTSGELSNAEMAAVARRRGGGFKTKFFELKGDTLFYRKHRRVPKGVTYALTYKVSLDTVYSAVYVRGVEELLLNVQGEAYVMRLREPVVKSGGADSELEVTPLSRWVQAIREHEIPYEEFD